MKLTYKNIILFVLPLIAALIIIFGFAGLDLVIWALSITTAYGLLMVGWILVEIFGD